jgi:hypothetical protein
MKPLSRSPSVLGRLEVFLVDGGDIEVKAFASVQAFEISEHLTSAADEGGEHVVRAGDVEFGVAEVGRAETGGQVR